VTRSRGGRPPKGWASCGARSQSSALGLVPEELPQQPVDREDGGQAQEAAGRQDEGVARPGALRPAGIGLGGGGAEDLLPVLLVQAPAVGDGQEGPEARPAEAPSGLAVMPGR